MKVVAMLMTASVPDDRDTETVGHAALLRKWKSWQRLCFASQATAPICLMSPRKFNITDKLLFFTKSENCARLMGVDFLVS